MAERPNIVDLTRQPLIYGTSSITDAAGDKGYKTDIVQVGVLLRIAEALEQNNDMLRATQAGFNAQDLEDGLNHFHLRYEKGLRLFDMHVLASSPEQAQTWIEQLNGFAQDLVAAANGGRMMRFTACVPVAAEHHQAFGAAVLEFNKFYEQPDPHRIFLAGFNAPNNEVIVRFANPVALFQLGTYWQDARQRLQQKGGEGNG